MTTTPIHSAAAFAADYYETHRPGPLEGDPDAIDALEPLLLPPITHVDAMEARRWLRERVSSPLLRAEVRALFRHGPRLAELVGLQYHRKMLLDLAARVSLPAAVDLVRAWPREKSGALALKRDQEAGELELYAEEFGCFGETVSAWVSEELIDGAAQGSDELRRRYLNAMRWLRLHEVVSNHWVAETMFPRVVRPPTAATLIWTVGPPVVVDQLQDFVAVDVVITATDEKARSARQRRELASDRVRHLLRQGLRVGLIANHSTVESREGVLQVARDLGAASIAVFFDVSDEAMEARNEAAGWPAPRRSVERVLELLEAPRPHEAEEVLVVGDGGLTARWQLSENVQGGFTEELST